MRFVCSWCLWRYNRCKHSSAGSNILFKVV